jgi:hypothetical protein
MGSGLKMMMMKHVTVVVEKGIELAEKISNILHLWPLKLKIKFHYR